MNFLRSYSLNKFPPILEDSGIPQITQTAYRKGVSCQDSIFASQEAIEKFTSDSNTVYTCFYDLASKVRVVQKAPEPKSVTAIQHMHTIFPIFGLPEILVTYNGPSFVSQEFEEFLHRNGIKHKTTDPYHPPSNGLAEWVVQIFKKEIRKM